VDAAPPPEIRSFRAVFALERRIYRIDTLRLNPSGIPLRGIVYAAAFVVTALIAGAVPPLAWLDPLVPWYLRDLGLPIVAAWLLGAARVDGRAFHVAALAALAHVAGPRRLDHLTARPGAARWRPPAVVWIPDGSDARFRRLRYRGPGAVLVRGPHERREWSRPGRRDVTLHPLAAAGGRTTVLELAEGAVLEVRGRR
jgi:hypothetical protein